MSRKTKPVKSDVEKAIERYQRVVEKLREQEERINSKAREEIQKIGGRIGGHLKIIDALKKGRE